MEQFDELEEARAFQRRRRAQVPEPMPEEMRQAIEETKRRIREAFASGKNKEDEKIRTDYMLDRQE